MYKYDVIIDEFIDNIEKCGDILCGSSDNDCIQLQMLVIKIFVRFKSNELILDHSYQEVEKLAGKCYKGRICYYPFNEMIFEYLCDFEQHVCNNVKKNDKGEKLPELGKFKVCNELKEVIENYENEYSIEYDITFDEENDTNTMNNFKFDNNTLLLYDKLTKSISDKKIEEKLHRDEFIEEIEEHSIVCTVAFYKYLLTLSQEITTECWFEISGEKFCKNNSDKNKHVEIEKFLKDIDDNFVIIANKKIPYQCIIFDIGLKEQKEYSESLINTINQGKDKIEVGEFEKLIETIDMQKIERYIEKNTFYTKAKYISNESDESNELDESNKVISIIVGKSDVNKYRSNRATLTHGTILEYYNGKYFTYDLAQCCCEIGPSFNSKNLLFNNKYQTFIVI